MDFLALVEPQLAVPVVAVVVLAVLVYLFGFQQTQEPSLQHLAVLHSGGKSKSSSTTTKQKNQSQNSASGQKGNAVKGKVVSNGLVVHNNEKSKTEKPVSNKENVKPQHSEQPTPKSKKDKKAENKPEEIDGGDWIPAVSRKDKKLRPKKEDLPEPAVKSKKSNASKNESPKAIKAVLKEIEVVPVVVAQDEAKITPASPASKDKKKKAPATPSVGGIKKLTEKSPDVPSISESKTDESSKEIQKSVEIKDVLSSPEKVASDSSASKASAKTKTADDPKNNIAFDEMGELWEEAKSRGAKKKRARKD